MWDFRLPPCRRFKSALPKSQKETTILLDYGFQIPALIVHSKMPNQDLHRLIHALTPNEKRYFKLNVLPFSRKENSAYLQLFEAIQEQESYDQAALLEKFAKENWINRFSAEKQYLYSLILKTMRAYVAEQKVYTRIRGQLQDIGWLYQKALYPESMRLLQRAKKLAREYEDHTAQIELLTWERKLLKRDNPVANQSQFESLLAQQSDLIKHLQAELNYASLYDRAYLLTQSDSAIRNPAKLEAVKTIFEQEKLKAPEETDTFQTKHLYHQIKAFEGHVTGNYHAAREHYARLTTLWQAHPHLCKEEQEKYKSILFNYLSLSTITAHYAQFPETIAKIKSLESHNPHERLRTTQSLIINQLQYFLNTGALLQGIDETEKADQWLQKHGDSRSVSIIVGICHLAASICFLTGAYRKALKWVNKVINQHGETGRRESVQFMRMLQMIIHFELGNHDLLENLIRSARRYFKKEGRLFEFEAQYLRTMRKLINRRPDQHQEQFERLQQALEKLGTEARQWPGEKDLRLWLESKIKNRSIAEIAKHRLQTQD